MEKTAVDRQAELKEELQAVATLERIYPGIRLLYPAGDEADNIAVRHKKRGRKPSKIRDRVAQAATEKALSISELVDATGLEKYQVRGCINAPALKDLYEREEDKEGVMKYQYVGD